MIYFTTEFEVNLPTEKEKDIYVSKVYAIIEDFLGDIAYKYKNTFGLKYNRTNNIFFFKWNDSLYTGTEEGEDRVKSISKEVEKFFTSNKYLKRHQVKNIATLYNIMEK